MDFSHKTVSVVSNILAVFPQTLQVSLDGIFGHLFGFLKRCTIGNASRQRGHKHRVSPFWLRPEDDGEVEVTKFHTVSIIAGRD